MKELDIVLRLRRDIDDLNERIRDLLIMTQPKAQTISDMPRGGGERKNAIEEYVVKSEELHSKLSKLEKRITGKWCDVMVIMNHSELTEAQRAMLELRFYWGLPWKKVTLKMQELYPETTWTENKIFAMYRRTLHKIDKRKIK